MQSEEEEEEEEVVEEVEEEEEEVEEEEKVVVEEEDGGVELRIPKAPAAGYSGNLIAVPNRQCDGAGTGKP